MIHWILELCLKVQKLSSLCHHLTRIERCCHRSADSPANTTIICLTSERERYSVASHISPLLVQEPFLIQKSNIQFSSWICEQQNKQNGFH